MSEARPQQVALDGRGRRVALIVSRYNEAITRSLSEGARETLIEFGVAGGDIREILVAGAFEIPLMAQQVLNKKASDGVIALGAVIRGDTPHFDYVCEAAMQGCLHVSLTTEKPVAFGVLTCDTMAQAEARAEPGDANKGREAALALLESFAALDQI